MHGKNQGGELGRAHASSAGMKYLCCGNARSKETAKRDPPYDGDANGNIEEGESNDSIGNLTEREARIVSELPGFYPGKEGRGPV